MSTPRRHIPKVCPVCGREFLAVRHTSVTCSKKCGSTLAGRKSAALFAAKRAGGAVCLRCGKPLTDMSSTNVSFCSPDCREAYHRNLRRKLRHQAAMETVTTEDMPCPWSGGMIHGTAAGADFSLGF